jgi:CHAT domain-containing protein
LERLRRSEELKRARVIAFATHAITAGRIGSTIVDEPYLLLSPPEGTPTGEPELQTRLTMSDIMALDLHADLVILSACSTAAPDGSLGSFGLSGLSQAFFIAGARGLVASHWPVESRATYYLVSDFSHELQTSRLSLGAALLAARRKLARDHGRVHPGFWAAFVLVADAERKLN